MRKLLTLLISLAACQCLADGPITETTPYIRTVLRAVDAATARTLLGIINGNPNAVTNTQGNVSLGGTFTGNGAGLTNSAMSSNTNALASLRDVATLVTAASSSGGGGNSQIYITPIIGFTNFAETGVGQKLIVSNALPFMPAMSKGYIVCTNDDPYTGSKAGQVYDGLLNQDSGAAGPTVLMVTANWDAHSNAVTVAWISHMYSTVPDASWSLSDSNPNWQNFGFFAVYSGTNTSSGGLDITAVSNLVAGNTLNFVGNGSGLANIAYATGAGSANTANHADTADTANGLVNTLSHVVFVDANGSDDTGTRGDISRPFANLGASQSHGDFILLGPGSFAAHGATEGVTVAGTTPNLTHVQGDSQNPIYVYDNDAFVNLTLPALVGDSFYMPATNVLLDNVVIGSLADVDVLLNFGGDDLRVRNSTIYSSWDVDEGASGSADHPTIWLNDEIILTDTNGTLSTSSTGMHAHQAGNVVSIGGSINIYAVTPASTLTKATNCMFQGGSDAIIRIYGTIFNHTNAPGASPTIPFWTTSTNVSGWFFDNQTFSLVITGKIFQPFATGHLSGDGSALTNIPATGISTNGGTTGQVVGNAGDGTVGWITPSGTDTSYRGGRVVFSLALSYTNILFSSPMQSTAYSVTTGFYGTGSEHLAESAIGIVNQTVNGFTITNWTGNFDSGAAVAWHALLNQ
ncbi:MAG: hypothetical protein ABSA45_03205 [Verrucomicrobiota bacterium]|jgi:hypothetical protein